MDDQLESGDSKVQQEASSAFHQQEESFEAVQIAMETGTSEEQARARAQFQIRNAKLTGALHKSMSEMYRGLKGLKIYTCRKLEDCVSSITSLKGSLEDLNNRLTAIEERLGELIVCQGEVCKYRQRPWWERVLIILTKAGIPFAMIVIAMVALAWKYPAIVYALPGVEPPQ